MNEREGVEQDQASAVRGSCKSWSSPVRGSVGQALSRSLVSQSFIMTTPIECTLSGSSSQHISQSPAGEAKAAPLPIQTHKQTLQHIGIKTTPPRHSHSSILRRSTQILSCLEPSLRIALFRSSPMVESEFHLSRYSHRYPRLYTSTNIQTSATQPFLNKSI